MKFSLFYIFSLIFAFRLTAQDTTVFNKKISEENQSIPNSASFPIIDIFKKRYYSVDENNIRSAEPLNFSITMIKVNNFSLLRNVPDLKTALEKTKKNIKRKKSFGIAGIPFCLSGVGMLMMSFMMSTAVGPNGNNEWAARGAIVGGSFLITGISFEITSIVNGIKKKKNLNKAVKIYNENLWLLRSAN